MNRVFLTAEGQIVKVISGNNEVIDNNTLDGDIYIDTEEYNLNNNYWDFIENKFVYYGTASEPYMSFNFKTKEWEDLRSLEDVKEAKWVAIKKERDSLEFGGFIFQGNVYDSDQIAQGRISTAASLGVPVEWTLADNSTIWLEPEDIQALVVALAQHVTSVHARGKIAREAIFNATTVDDVNAVVL